MILKFYGEKIECSRVEKGEDFIICYDEKNNIISEFRGISDFSGFSVEGGEFEEAPKTEIEQLQDDSLNTMLGLAESYETMNSEDTKTMLALAEVYELLLGGEK